MDDSRVLEEFGANLRSIRILKSISQEKLAEIANLDRTYISGIERGKRNVSIINIFKIAKALELDASVLLKFNNFHEDHG